MQVAESPSDLVQGRISHDAFLSYPSARSDTALAIRDGLRRLQGLARMRGKQLDVFYDKENLAAHSALWPQLDAHLLGSKHLIVVTHRDLDQDSYVRREVHTWIDHKGTENIVIVIVDDPQDDAPGGGDESSKKAGFQNPPPFEEIDFEPAVIEEHNYRKRARLGGLVRIPPNDPRTMYARIVSAITGRPMRKVLRDRQRWARTIAAAALVALSFVIIGVWQASSAEADRERAMAIQLQQEDLVGNGFTSQHLRDAVYTNKAFDESNFSDSQLTDITIVASTGADAQFDRAVLTNVTLDGSRFPNWELSCGDIVGIATNGQACVGATLQNVTITAGSRIDGANFEFAQIDGLLIEGSSAKGVSFVGAAGQGLTISNSDISGAVFDLLTIDDLIFEGVCFDDKTAWPTDIEVPRNYQRSCK